MRKRRPRHRLGAVQGHRLQAAGAWPIRLTENGSSIGFADQNWAQEPPDGSEGWTPDTRMHVASPSKIVTAIAMTRLLDEAGISPGTPIMNYLPGYWVKGPNVDQITFAELMTHTSGLAFGATNSRSDFEWMKSQIAAGTTHTGQYSYQNMNFGLCRILLATINGNIPVDWALPGWLGWLFGPEFNDIFWDLITVRAYASYAASRVFAPAGVTGPDFTHDAADALAYDFPVTGNGWNSSGLLPVQEPLVGVLFELALDLLDGLRVAVDPGHPAQRLALVAEHRHGQVRPPPATSR